MTDSLQVVPIRVQYVMPGNEIRYWVDFVEPVLTITSVRVSMHNDWVIGSRVHVGRNTAPLKEDDTVRPAPGSLVTIVHPYCRLPRLQTLGQKMRAPLDNFADIAVEGYPEEFPSELQYVLLQPVFEPQCLTYAHTGQPGFEDVFLHRIASELYHPVRLCRPDITDAVVRGHHAGTVVGAFPSNCTSRVPVFIDLRSLCPVCKCMAFPPNPCTEFLAQAGLVLPDVSRLEVTF